MQVVAIARSSSTTIGGARARAVGTAPVSRKDAKRPRARRYLSPRPATPNKGTWNAESSMWHTRKQGKDTSRIGGERRVHWRYGKAMKTLLGAACPGHPLPFLHLNLQGGTLSFYNTLVLPSWYSITPITSFPLVPREGPWPMRGCLQSITSCEVASYQNPQINNVRIDIACTCISIHKVKIIFLFVHRVVS